MVFFHGFSTLVHNRCHPALEESPLHAAAASGSVEVVQLLMSAGAEKDHVGQQGSVPLHIASWFLGYSLKAVFWILSTVHPNFAWFIISPE